MIYLMSLLESYIRIEKSPSNLTIADGEAGRGIYFSLIKYPKMIDYYKKHSPHGSRIIKATPKFKSNIVDLTEPIILNELINFMRDEIVGLSKRMPGYKKPNINKSNYQRYGSLIQSFLRGKKIDGYIVNHEFVGSDLPTGKQLIVINEDMFEYEDVVEEEDL